MKERPILFSAPMVQAIRRDTNPKTQTRRAINPQPKAVTSAVLKWKKGLIDIEMLVMVSRYGQAGDRLWTREAWRPTSTCLASWTGVHYKADGAHIARPYFTANHAKTGWRPSIHMPRLASRDTLEVIDVRVERLQDISEADAMAEGVEELDDEWEGLHFCHDDLHGAFRTARDAYFDLWERINGKASLESNPWVWVIEFKRKPCI